MPRQALIFRIFLVLPFYAEEVSEPVQIALEILIRPRACESGEEALDP